MGNRPRWSCSGADSGNRCKHSALLTRHRERLEGNKTLIALVEQANQLDMSLYREATRLFRDTVRHILAAS